MMIYSVNLLVICLQVIAVSTQTSSQILMGDYPIMNTKTCGYRKPGGEPQTRIVMGDIAQDGEFPWMAAIHYMDRRAGNDTFAASGALISDRFVVTVKHCLINLVKKYGNVDVQLLKVYMGSSHRDQYLVSSSVESYDLNMAHDLALIRLTDSLKPIVKPKSDYYAVNSICLPMKGIQNSEPELVWVSGFGVIDVLGRQQSLVLRKAQLTMDPVGSCDRKYSPINQICGHESTHRVCYGDSGSPVVQYMDDRAVLVAIIIAGKSDLSDHNCGAGTFQGTRISMFIDWLKIFIEPPMAAAIHESNKESKSSRKITIDMIPVFIICITFVTLCIDIIL